MFPAAQAPSVVSRGLWVPTTEVRESGGGREAPPQLLGAQWGSLGRERWPWPAGGVGSSPVGPGRGSEVWVAMPSHPGWVGGLHQRAPTHPEDCGQPKAIRDVGRAPPRWEAEAQVSGLAVGCSRPPRTCGDSHTYSSSCSCGPACRPWRRGVPSSSRPAEGRHAGSSRATPCPPPLPTGARTAL